MEHNAIITEVDHLWALVIRSLQTYLNVFKMQKHLSVYTEKYEETAKSESILIFFSILHVSLWMFK